MFGMNVQCVKASNLTLIALWSQYGASRPRFNINLVTASWDPDGGAVQVYKWYKNNILVSQTSSYNFTETLEEGEVNKVITIKLMVQDDEQTWGTRISTITITTGNRTEYYLTDHLGSIRTTIDQTGTVIGYDDYDPFGNVLPGRSYNAGTPNDLNKFTGHERDQEGGLDLDYMLARNYDSELGRFYSVDPKYFKYQNLSPYSYAANNPMRFIDPNGKEIIDQITNLKLRSYIERFVATSVGKSIFAQFAKAGKTYFGHTFSTNGRFHDSKVILSQITPKTKGSYPAGITKWGFYNDKKKRFRRGNVKGDFDSGDQATRLDAQIEFTLPNVLSSYENDVLTVEHEFIIHLIEKFADLYEKVINCNGELDEVVKLFDELQLLNNKGSADHLKAQSDEIALLLFFKYQANKLKSYENHKEIKFFHESEK